MDPVLNKGCSGHVVVVVAAAAVPGCMSEIRFAEGKTGGD